MATKPLPLLETSREQMEAMKQILAFNDLNIPRIPEQMFVEHLLPVLTNASEKQDLSWWMKIAGSLQTPLDIVDTQDRVLFRVPPLQRRTHLPMDDIPRQTIFEAVHTAKLKNDYIPGHGDRYLTNVLTGRLTMTEFSAQDLADWNAIRVRYGYPPVGGEPPAGVTPVTVAPAEAPGKLKPQDFLGSFDDF